jgi:hypothetical protein
LSVDQLNTNYLATTQDGFIAQAQIDNQRYTAGKADLDLQKDLNTISPELFDAKLKQLTLDTNTFRNAMLALKPATKGFFDDIFAGQGVFDGLGNSLKNLATNILKHFQDIISKQLGEQLFNSLIPNEKDLEKTAGKNKDVLTDTVTKIGDNINFGITPTIGNPQTPILPEYKFDGLEATKATIFNNLRKTQTAEFSPDFIGPIYQPPSIPKKPEANVLSSLGSMLPAIGLKLLGIPGFATGGVVSSPTVALVGEGIHNEAIVPLPNGRSIPVDLQGAGESSGKGGDINNAISVTIQNSGQAKETSRGDSLAIVNLVRNLVTEGLVNEKRPGGLLA